MICASNSPFHAKMAPASATDHPDTLHAGPLEMVGVFAMTAASVGLLPALAAVGVLWGSMPLEVGRGDAWLGHAAPTDARQGTSMLVMVRHLVHMAAVSTCYV